MNHRTYHESHKVMSLYKKICFSANCFDQEHSPRDFVFRKVSHTANGIRLRRQQMTYSRARELFSKQLREIGLDPSVYGLHSLRSGGETEAAAWGISEPLIQRHGGWRSEASTHMYIRETKHALLRVSKSLGL